MGCPRHPGAGVNVHPSRPGDIRCNRCGAVVVGSGPDYKPKNSASCAVLAVAVMAAGLVLGILTSGWSWYA